MGRRPVDREDHSKAFKRILCHHLGEVARYNDRGHVWSRDDEAERRAKQSRSEEIVLRLVREIGETAFSRTLLDKLRSGAASRDGSGLIAEQARCELLGPE